MTWQTWLFLPVFFGAMGYSLLQIRRLGKLMKASTGKTRVMDEMGARVRETLINVLGQKAVLRDKKAGIMHATIFWGFLIITLGTLEQFVSTLVEGANFEFLGSSIYQALVFFQDFFTVAVLLAVGYAFYVRLVVRPERLGKSKDALKILAFTGGLMVSILLMNAFHLAGTQPWFASAMIFSNLLSGLAPSDPSICMAGYTFFKWIHMILVLGFAMYIPHSKHLHVLAAGPNTFFKTLTVEKGMQKIDFEDETLTQYGAAKVTDLSWKDTLDTFACTECGRCQDLCPAWNTQKPLSPKAIISDLKKNLLRNQAAILSGKIEDVTPVIDDNVTEDVIWACTSCRACEVACPVFIEQTDKIYAIRRNLVLMESRFPAEVQNVFKNMENNATPWAFSASDRANWSQGLSIPTIQANPNAEVLLWVGCAGSYDDRNKKVVTAFASLLKKAGVSFAILGNEEKCTGDPARRIGNEYLFQTLAKSNIETLNRHQIKTIVTSCPHCFNTLKNEYPDFGGKYQVFHHSQYLVRLMNTGRLKPAKNFDETVTYHDSCYLGRWNSVYEQPRSLISAIPSAHFVEMTQNREKGMCCGAGGGRMWMEEKIGKSINIVRTEQAIATKATVVASACPFCMTMLTDGVKAKDLQSKMKVMDVAEILDQSIS